MSKSHKPMTYNCCFAREAYERTGHRNSDTINR